ncbi:MAG: ECF transporter S component [Clostridia bacterium]|nr:ECF transporter S component [Clostridia bacterium]
MFQKKSWLFLAVAFALMILALCLPFERIAAQKGGEEIVTPLNGLALVANDGSVTLLEQGGAAAPMKRLTDESGAPRTDWSYVYALILTAAVVGLGCALLDRRGRRKGWAGVICAALAFGLSFFMVFRVNAAYRLSAKLAETVPDYAEYVLTAAPGVGFTVMIMLSSVALALSIIVIALTPKAAAAENLNHTMMITRVGVLGAIAAVLAYIPGIPIIPPIYKLDFSNVPALLGGFSMGPMPGLCILLIKDAVSLLNTSSMGVGELADIMTGAAMMIPAALIYKRNRTLKGALTGLLWGVAATVLVGAAANYFIMIPFYVNVMNMPLETILAMIAQVVPAVDTLPKLILLATSPFNLIKGVVLALVTCVLYKRLSPILKNM